MRVDGDHRRRRRDRGARAPAGVDVTERGPQQDVAARDGEDARLVDRDVAAGHPLDRAAPEGEDAEVRRCQPGRGTHRLRGQQARDDVADELAAGARRARRVGAPADLARSEHLDVAAALGAHLAEYELDVADPVLRKQHGERVVGTLVVAHRGARRIGRGARGLAQFGEERQPREHGAPGLGQRLQRGPSPGRIEPVGRHAGGLQEGGQFGVVPAAACRTRRCVSIEECAVVGAVGQAGDQDDRRTRDRKRRIVEVATGLDAAARAETDVAAGDQLEQTCAADPDPRVRGRDLVRLGARHRCHDVAAGRDERAVVRIRVLRDECEVDDVAASSDLDRLGRLELPSGRGGQVVGHVAAARVDAGHRGIAGMKRYRCTGPGAADDARELRGQVDRGLGHRCARGEQRRRVVVEHRGRGGEAARRPAGDVAGGDQPQVSLRGRRQTDVDVTHDHVARQCLEGEGVRPERRAEREVAGQRRDTRGREQADGAVVVGPQRGIAAGCTDRQPGGVPLGREVRPRCVDRLRQHRRVDRALDARARAGLHGQRRVAELGDGAGVGTEHVPAAGHRSASTQRTGAALQGHGTADHVAAGLDGGAAATEHCGRQPCGGRIGAVRRTVEAPAGRHGDRQVGDVAARDHVDAAAAERADVLAERIDARAPRGAGVHVSGVRVAPHRHIARSVDCAAAEQPIARELSGLCAEHVPASADRDVAAPVGIGRPLRRGGQLERRDRRSGRAGGVHRGVARRGRGAVGLADPDVAGGRERDVARGGPDGAVRAEHEVAVRGRTHRHRVGRRRVRAGDQPERPALRVGERCSASAAVDEAVADDGRQATARDDRPTGDLEVRQRADREHARGAARAVTREIDVAGDGHGRVQRALEQQLRPDDYRGVGGQAEGRDECGTLSDECIGVGPRRIDVGLTEGRAGDQALDAGQHDPAAGGAEGRCRGARLQQRRRRGGIEAKLHRTAVRAHRTHYRRGGGAHVHAGTEGEPVAAGQQDGPAAPAFAAVSAAGGGDPRAVAERDAVVRQQRNARCRASDATQRSGDLEPARIGGQLDRGGLQSHRHGIGADPQVSGPLPHRELPSEAARHRRAEQARGLVDPVRVDLERGARSTRRFARARAAQRRVGCRHAARAGREAHRAAAHAGDCRDVHRRPAFRDDRTGPGRQLDPAARCIEALVEHLRARAGRVDHRAGAQDD